jgi:hypothetical protein
MRDRRLHADLTERYCLSGYILALPSIGADEHSMLIVIPFRNGAMASSR